MSHQILFLTLIFLAAAVVAVPLAKKIGLGSILGYLIAGTIIGPSGAAIFSNVSGLLEFSEFGVVFLLFMIGLELRPARLWQIRKSVFGLGSTQVFLTTGFLSIVFMLFGFSLLLSVVLGFALSLSSTAFALQYLNERNQLTTDYGRSAVGILLFQDVAVIPALAILPLLFVGLGANSPVSSWLGIVVVAVILFLGRWLTNPIFRFLAASRSREVFTAVTLLIVIGIATLMYEVGLSMAFGSFLVGVLLSDSEYRHELETDIEPFKGLLLGLFFMSVGMMMNTRILIEHPGKILIILFLYLVLKFSALFLSAKLFNFTNTSSRNLSFSIIQGSEFTFVIVNLLLVGNIVNQETSDLLIMTVALSMTMTPLLGIVNDRFLSRKFQQPKKKFDEIKNEHPEVIIAGVGRFGQMFSRVLAIKEIKFTALEHDPEQVETLRKFGIQVYYGDASRLDLLEKAGAQTAKYFVLAIDDVEASMRTAEVVRKAYPHLKIFARARNRNHAIRLWSTGIRKIERETFWSSINLTKDLLFEWGEAKESIDKTMELFIKHDLNLLEDKYEIKSDLIQKNKHIRKLNHYLIEVMKDDKTIARTIPASQGKIDLL
ncbi:MAG: monovalent cation:proton antiporter-2 (CPA2) family protein [Pseudobdellovibrio sp.]